MIVRKFHVYMGYRLPNKFVNFSSYLRKPVLGFKKEIGSLLKKLETRKEHGVKSLDSKRSHRLISHFERELRKLESSINYNSSSRDIRRKGRNTRVSTSVL